MDNIEKSFTSLLAASKKFRDASISESTKRAYRSDWLNFLCFCDHHGLTSLPASSDTISAYLVLMSNSQRSVSTINRALTSINKAHVLSGHPSIRTPEVLACLSGIRKQNGMSTRQARAISYTDLIKMAAACASTLVGVRDRALLMLGWTGALRRSELTALNIGDLDFCDNGVLVHIRSSKTDQDGRGSQLAIPYSSDRYCPIVALKAWIDRIDSSDPDTPLFRVIGSKGAKLWFQEFTKLGSRISDRFVSRCVKHYARLIGLSPNQYSAHSLRRGFATECGARNVPERIIARHTRHRSTAVLRGYIESGQVWTENPLLSIYAPDPARFLPSDGEKL